MASRERILSSLTSLKVAYPVAYQKMTKVEGEALAKQWEMFFKDRTDRELAYGVNYYIANNTTSFPPSIGQLNEIMDSAREPEMTELEAWQMIKKGLRNCGEWADAEKFYNSLPEPVKRATCVSNLTEWARLPSDTVDRIIGPSFRKSFGVKQQKAHEYQALPENMRNVFTFIPLEEPKDESK